MSRCSRCWLAHALLVVVVPFLSSLAPAQSESPRPFSRLGVGVKISLLGPGIEVATPLSRRANLRGGFNAFSYDRVFHDDGVTYDGQLTLRSAELHYDWFPFNGGFHVSPGVLVYNGNQIKGNASVPGGSTFTLDNTEYISDPNNPITGTGKVDFNRAGPMFTVGWGNLLPRNGRRFSVPFEVGFVYTGAPRTALAFGGGACDFSGVICQPVSSDPTFQANVQAQRAKVDNDLSPLRFYPVISLGFALNF